MPIIDKNIKVGRLAPSPSGEMHLGNALTYVLAWCTAKKEGGKVLFRMEDIDDRCKSGDLKNQAIEDMLWLGLSWDGEIIYQSNRTNIYDEIFNELTKQRLVYPCFCSRADLHASMAPHNSDGTYAYSGKCKNLSMREIEEMSRLKSPAHRIKVPNIDVSFIDEICGKFTQNLASECGDFVIKRSDGIYAYQFVTSVDDYLHGVNQIVRGNDLLSSSPRQVFLRNAIECILDKNFEYHSSSAQINNVAQNMQFVHVPLLTDESGRRLAKRDRDLTIRRLRENNVGPERIIGYFAYILELTEECEPITLEELIAILDINKIEYKNIIVDYKELL